MRCNFKIYILAAIMVIAVAPTWAQAINFGSGICIETMTPQSGIFSHIDMAYKGRIIGGWFSTSGYLPVMVKSNDISYTAYGDFIGIPGRKVEKAVLTPDGGKTQWPATQIPGKGWQVQIPFGTRTETVQTVKDVKVRGRKTEKTVIEETQTVLGLEPGGYSLEWGVVSRDKQNRIMIIIIPINYVSTRTSYSGVHALVQREVGNIAVLNDAAINIYLREHGFQPAVDTFSPAVMAAMQIGQPVQSAPVQAVQPSRVEQPCESDGTIREEITAGPAKAEFQSAAPESKCIQLKIYLWPLKATKPVVWNARVEEDWYNELTNDSQLVKITRGGRRIVTGEAQASNGIIEIHLLSSVVPETGDKIETIEEGGN